MNLPLDLSLKPMEAQLKADLPSGPEWQFEPKWDGFRALVFRDGDQVAIQSKSGQPLARYFPEMVDAVKDLAPKRFVIDGELVIPEGDTLAFDSLLLRIHPAESRVAKLARDMPALLIAFDLLADEKGRNLTREHLQDRRVQLEAFWMKHLRASSRIHLSPATRSRDQAAAWLSAPGGNLDGVMAKRLAAPYRSGERDAMVKVKRIRTADCVVGGFRYAARARVVGSLLLGLFDVDGKLHHVGFTSSVSKDEQAELTSKLEPLIEPPGFTGRAPGGPSRWSTKRSSEWQPLKSSLVVEVAYDHFSGGRFRHGTRLVRWRPEKAPQQCRLEQVAEESRVKWREV